MKRKWWWVCVGIAAVLLGFWFGRDNGRLVMERTLNRHGCLIGMAPDGRVAMVADGNLVFIDTNRVETTVAKLEADGIQGMPVGTNGFILVNSVFGAGTSMHMFDWAGRRLWTYSIPSRWLWIGVSQEATIYAWNETNVLYALNLDGTLRWSDATYSSRRFLSGSPAIGADGRVAILGDDGTLSVLDRTGAELWSDTRLAKNPLPWHAAFGDDGNLVVSAALELRRYDENGRLLWDRNGFGDFSAMIDADPIFGPDGIIYCLAKDRVLAVDPSGNQLWQRTVASYTPNTWNQGRGRDWGTFNRDGELVTLAADYEYLQSPSKQGSGIRPLVILAGNQRLMCLRKDGSVRWEQSIPSSIEWKIPTSRWDWKILWKSRMGLNNLKSVSSMTIAADGTIYGLGRDSSKTKIWAIKAD